MFARFSCHGNSMIISIPPFKKLYIYIYIYIYIYNNDNIYIFFFIIQRVKARAIPCPHQPPTRGDNTVSVAQGGTATPGATKQLLPPDRVLRELYIYIYTPDQLRAETTLNIYNSMEFRLRPLVCHKLT